MSNTQATQLVKSTNPTSIVGQAPPNPFGLLFEPKTKADMWWVCQHFARMPTMPEVYHGNPFAVYCTLEMGGRFGLSPMAALQNISVIKGKWSIQGDMMLAICQTRVEFDVTYDYFTVTGDKGQTLKTTDGENAIGCRITIERKNHKPVVEEFTSLDAERAGLLAIRPGKSGGPWHTYRKRMCMYRARGFALRNAFPALLAGFISSEEAQDYPILDGKTKQPVDRPAADKVVDADNLPPPGCGDAIANAPPADDAVDNAATSDAASVAAEAADGSMLAELRDAITAATTQEHLNAIAAKARSCAPAVRKQIKASWASKEREIERRHGKQGQAAQQSKTERLMQSQGSGEDESQG